MPTISDNFIARRYCVTNCKRYICYRGAEVFHVVFLQVARSTARKRGCHTRCSVCRVLTMH